MYCREPSQDGGARPKATPQTVPNKTLLVDHQSSPGTDRSVSAAQKHSTAGAAANTAVGKWVLHSLPLNFFDFTFILPVINISILSCSISMIYFGK